MNLLRAAAATAVLVLGMGLGGGYASAQSSRPQQTEPPAPAESKAAPVEGKTPVLADREPRAKEKTPPPRPIVPPEGQQQNPALREECAWVGQRIVSLLFRDDAMSGSDFIPFYEQFGCPREHLSKAFGCVVSSGNAENDVLADRIAACWTDPIKRPSPVGRAAEPEKQGEPAAQPAKPANGGGK